MGLAITGGGNAKRLTKVRGHIEVLLYACKWYYERWLSSWKAPLMLGSHVCGVGLSFFPGALNYCNVAL